MVDPQCVELDLFVAAFEAALARPEPVDLGAYLPPREHPLYRAVLLELVRIDLETCWNQSRPKYLEEYQQRFPELFQDQETVQDLAFEEYRLRRQAGEHPLLSEYDRRFGKAGGSGIKVPPVTIGEALAALPSPFKELAELRTQGDSLAEIARKTGYAQEKVETLIQEALKRLHSLLQAKSQPAKPV